jgi:hypothetical protein
MSEKSFTELANSAQDSRNIEEIVGEPEEVSEGEWKYSVPKKHSILIEGKEVAMASDDKAEEVYGGKFVRDLFESRKYRPKSYTWLGYIDNPKRGVKEAGIPHDALFKHTALFGNSGYGKSTVMKNMMLQWIQSGYGVCFIDPKGDDSPKMLRTIPEHRMDDIVWVEPGATSGRQTVGFNILETEAEPGTEEQETEANNIAEDILGLLEAKARNWSPQLDGVVSTVLERMIKDDKGYTLGDLYKLAKSSSEREMFLDMYEEELDSMEKEYIENIEQNELNELETILKEILSKPIMKQTIAEPNSSINISEAIEKDKIILANFSNISDEDLEFLTSAVVRRIWSKIKSKKDIPEKEREPYFLCIDEFDNVTKDFAEEDEDLLRIAEILSTARSYRLSCMVANQNPTQLAEDIKNDVYGNCNNLFTFNQGNFQDAGDLASPIEDVESRHIMSLSYFELIGRLTIDGDKTPGIIINTFAEYPPLRSQEEVDRKLNEVCKKYGISSTQEFDEDSHGVIRYQENKKSRNSTVINNMSISTENVLSLIKSGEFNENSPESLEDSQLEEIFESHIGKSRNYDKVKKEVITKHVGEEVVEDTEGSITYHISEKGNKTLKEEMEDQEVYNMHKLLSKKGYYSSIPFKMVDSDFFDYDLIAYPPIMPVDNAQTFQQAKELNQYLKKKYPDIYDEFKDYRILVKHSKNPEKNLKTISKALSNTRKKSKCLILCDSKEEAEALYNIIQNNKLYKNREENKLYNTSYLITIGNNNKKPVIKGEEKYWTKDEEGNFRIEKQNGKELVYESFQDLNSNFKGEELDYYIKYGEEEKILLKENQNHETIKSFDNIQEVMDSKEYNIIRKPFIPENNILQNISEERWSPVYIEDNEIKII